MLIAIVYFCFFLARALLGLSVVSSESSDHLWNLVASVAGGVIGALAGGLPAYALANRTSREGREKDLAARTDVELATLQSAFVKLLEITNSYLTICRQINSMIDGAHLAGHKDMQTWQKVKSLVGFEDGPSVRFTSQEIALFLKNPDDNEFANLLMLLDRRYAAFLAAIKVYSDRREKLSESLVPDEFVDGVGKIDLGGEQYRKMQPMAFGVNAMAEHIVVAMHSDRRLAQKLGDEFGWRAKRLYPDRMVPYAANAPPDAPQNF